MDCTIIISRVCLPHSSRPLIFGRCQETLHRFDLPRNSSSKSASAWSTRKISLWRAMMWGELKFHATGKCSNFIHSSRKRETTTRVRGFSLMIHKMFHESASEKNATRFIVAAWRILLSLFCGKQSQYFFLGDFNYMRGWDSGCCGILI